MLKLIFIIPAYNESKNIEKVIKDIKISIPKSDIVVINDCSKDDTKEIVEKNNIPCITMPFNVRYAMAVQTGIKYAYQNGYDYAILIDGDGQHIPSEAKKLLEKIEKTNADIVIGSRFIEKTDYKHPFFRKLGTKIFSGMIQLLCKKKTNEFLILLLSGVTLLSGLTVHPLAKGLSIIYDKPAAYKIREIVKSNPNGRWMTISTSYYVQNYILANGAKVINSTNYYPNYELWDVLDPSGEYIDIYNRFAHLNVDIVNEKTLVELLYMDAIKLKINKYDLCKIDVKYLATSLNLQEETDKDINFKNIYDEDDFKIFEIKCNI